jgi:hypothetical protein
MPKNHNHRKEERLAVVALHHPPVIMNGSDFLGMPTLTIGLFGS